MSRNVVGLALAQWALRLLAVVSLLGGVVGVLGQFGTQWIMAESVPRPISEFVQRAWPESGRVPKADVLVQARYRDGSFAQLNDGWPREGRVPPHWAEFSPQFSTFGTDQVGGAASVSFVDPSIPLRSGWLLLIVLTSLGLAWLWWTMSSVVGTARTGDPFVHTNSRRLATIAAVVGLGPVAAFAARHELQRLMLAESSGAERATVWFRWEDLPVWPLGVGLALFVLAAVWRRGVAMRQDLEGLV